MTGSALLVKLRRFWHRPWFERLWFLPVWGLLGAARLAVLLVPGRYLLGRVAGAVPLSLRPTSAQLVQAQRIGRVVRSAAAYTPWNSNCLAQALVARLLLNLHGIPHILFLGLSRHHLKAGGLMPHAWVMAGRVAVTGGHALASHTVVGVFARPPTAGGLSCCRWLR